MKYFLKHSRAFSIISFLFILILCTEISSPKTTIPQFSDISIQSDRDEVVQTSIL